MQFRLEVDHLTKETKKYTLGSYSSLQIPLMHSHISSPLDLLIRYTISCIAVRPCGHSNILNQ